eukprot:scaffold14.g1153.t1
MACAGRKITQEQRAAAQGSGLANTCPILEGGTPGSITDVAPGQYQIERFCMEPTSFKVKEESQFKGGDAEFVPTKLLTRMTYTLDQAGAGRCSCRMRAPQPKAPGRRPAAEAAGAAPACCAVCAACSAPQMSGKLTVGSKGEIALSREEDGLDYAAVTVKLPGGEEAPFLFSIKNLQAKGTADGIAGTFDVPAYRGSSFMDPKGRGGSTGYDFHTGLQAANDVLERQDNKTATLRHGEAVFAVDVETGEVAGVFSTVQPVSDDQGNKDPTDVLTQGIWYAKLAV